MTTQLSRWCDRSEVVTEGKSTPSFRVPRDTNWPIIVCSWKPYTHRDLQEMSCRPLPKLASFVHTF